MGWTFNVKYDVRDWHFELVSAKPHPPRYMLTTSYGLNFALVFSHGNFRTSVLTSCCRALLRHASRNAAHHSNKFICMKCGRVEPKGKFRMAVASTWAPGQALPDNMVAGLDQYFNPLEAAMEAGTLLMVLESLAELTPQDRRTPSLWSTLRHKRVLQEVITP